MFNNIITDKTVLDIILASEEAKTLFNITAANPSLVWVSDDDLPF